MALNICSVFASLFLASKPLMVTASVALLVHCFRFSASFLHLLQSRKQCGDLKMSPQMNMITRRAALL